MSGMFRPHLMEEVTAATNRLLASAVRLTDEQAGDPSLLPGWSRGHVLTHLARNADGLGNLLHWALTGKPAPMYAGPGAREDGIEAGAARGTVDLIEDVRGSATRWVERAAALPAAAWEHPVVLWKVDGPVPAKAIVSARLAEVEMHHVDLDCGYRFDATPARAAVSLLDTCRVRLRRLSPAITVTAEDLGRSWTIGEAAAAAPEAIVGTAGDLLGWLTGRADGARLRAPRGALPALPSWG